MGLTKNSGCRIGVRHDRRETHPAATKRGPPQKRWTRFAGPPCVFKISQSLSLLRSKLLRRRGVGERILRHRRTRSCPRGDPVFLYLLICVQVLRPRCNAAERSVRARNTIGKLSERPDVRVLADPACHVFREGIRRRPSELPGRLSWGYPFFGRLKNGYENFDFRCRITCGMTGMCRLRTLTRPASISTKKKAPCFKAWGLVFIKLYGRTTNSEHMLRNLQTRFSAVQRGTGPIHVNGRIF